MPSWPHRIRPNTQKAREMNTNLVGEALYAYEIEPPIYSKTVPLRARVDHNSAFRDGFSRQKRNVFFGHM